MIQLPVEYSSWRGRWKVPQQMRTHVSFVQLYLASAMHFLCTCGKQDVRWAQSIYRQRHYHNGSGNLFNTINSYCAYFTATRAGLLFGFSHLCIINYILNFLSQCWCHLPSGQCASQWRTQRHDQNTQADIRTPDSSNSSAVGKSRETSKRSRLGFVFEASTSEWHDLCFQWSSLEIPMMPFQL